MAPCHNRAVVTGERIAEAAAGEIGVAQLYPAATTPVDAGRYRVVPDGHRIVHDPDGILAALAEACR